jgi:hypothetical protein
MCCFVCRQSAQPTTGSNPKIYKKRKTIKVRSLKRDKPESPVTAHFDTLERQDTRRWRRCFEKPVVVVRRVVLVHVGVPILVVGRGGLPGAVQVSSLPWCVKKKRFLMAGIRQGVIEAMHVKYYF